MKNKAVFLAKKATYVGFLSKSVDDNNLTSIEHWVKRNLIDTENRTPKDTALAFFQQRVSS